MWRISIVLCSALMLIGGALLALGERPATSDVTEQVLLSRGEHGYECYRAPGLVRTNADTLLLFLAAKKGSCQDREQTDLVMLRSTDNGGNWTDPEVIWSADPGGDPPMSRGGGPPIVDRETGRIVLFTVTHPIDGHTPRELHLSTSDDDGQNWDRRSLLGEIGEQDWEHLVVGPSHGIQLQHDPHAGRLVHAMTFREAGGPESAGLIYSDDGGVSWELGATYRYDDGTGVLAQEMSPFEYGDGDIGVLARDQNGVQSEGENKAFAISEDGGESFAGPFRNVDGLTAPVVQGATLALRSTADGDKYNRVLFSSPSHPSEREVMTIRSSYNEGRTWDGTNNDGKVIFDGWAAYSDMVEIGTGEIGLAYEAVEWGDVNTASEIRFTRFTEEDLGLPDDYSGPVETVDRSGQGNRSYLRGGLIHGAEGRFEGAVELDGTNDYVQVPFAESLAVDDGDFTAMAWIRYDVDTGNRPIVWAYNQGSQYSQMWLRAEPENGRLHGRIQRGGTGASVTSSSAYSDNQWHHVALQREGDQLRLWVDGAVVDSTTAPSGNISPGRPFRFQIGQRLDGAQHFLGSLDEARLYKRALSAGEVSSIYESNATGIADAVLRLPFVPVLRTTPDTSDS